VYIMVNEITVMHSDSGRTNWTDRRGYWTFPLQDVSPHEHNPKVEHVVHVACSVDLHRTP